MLERVTLCGEYAGQEEIIALAKLFSTNIVVINQALLEWDKVYTINDLKKLKDNEKGILLGYINKSNASTIYLAYYLNNKKSNGGEGAHFTSIVKIN